MKTLNLFSLLFFAMLFFNITASAQDVLSADKDTIRGNTDVIFKSKSISRDSFLVADTENELSDLKLNVYSAAKFSKRPAYVIYPTITEVFSKERLQLLIRERSLIINYYVTKTGAVKEVTFSFRKFTTINADELAKLEYRILKNISFAIPAKATKGEDLFILRDEVPYRGILDHTLI